MRRLLFLPIAFLAVQCAEPTNVIIDVRADLVLCDPTRGIKRTGIAVSEADRVESDPLEVFQGPGCEAPGDRVGTLVLTPSDKDDAEFGVRVVAGVDKPAEQCRLPDYAGCIVRTEQLRFTPGISKTVTVILAAACEGKGPSCTP